jgi:hypothetical protein
VSDLAQPAIRRAFARLAALRGDRVFHPRGLSLSGTLRAVDEQACPPLAGSDVPVTARLSKGIGLPDAVPDILGLALRIPDCPGGPWDLALATTGVGTVSRFAVLPARGWRSARYGSLMAYRFADSGPRWLFAEPDDDQPASPALEDLASFAAEHPLRFRLGAASFAERPRPLADLTLIAALPPGAAPPSYDPVAHCPNGVELVPRSVSRLRQPAYRGSREGRSRDDRS